MMGSIRLLVFANFAEAHFSGGRSLSQHDVLSQCWSHAIEKMH